MQPNQFSLANQYNLSGRNLHITYLPHGTATDRQPKFTYQDLQQTLNFSGEQIRSVEVEIGVLVSVTIRMTRDTGGTTFSLLIPRVNIPGETSVPIETIGITTLHKFSIVPQNGQQDFYTSTRLRGTASNLGPTPS